MYKNKLPYELCLHILSYLPPQCIIVPDISVKHAYLFYSEYQWCDLYQIPRNKMIDYDDIKQISHKQMLSLLLHTNFEFHTIRICSQVSAMADELSIDDQILLQTVR